MFCTLFGIYLHQTGKKIGATRLVRTRWPGVQPEASCQPSLRLSSYSVLARRANVRHYPADQTGPPAAGTAAAALGGLLRLSSRGELPAESATVFGSSKACCRAGTIRATRLARLTWLGPLCGPLSSRVQSRASSQAYQCTRRTSIAAILPETNCQPSLSYSVDPAGPKGAQLL